MEYLTLIYLSFYCSLFHIFSKVPIDFNWEVPEGFEISPSSASLSPKQSCKLTATFKPCSVIVYSASAVCLFSSELDIKEGEGVKTKSMKVEGVGKYPHITVKLWQGKKISSKKETHSNTVTEAQPLNTCTTTNVTVQEEDSTRLGDGTCGCSNESVVDFGAVAVGSVLKKRIELTNVSPVSLLQHIGAHSRHIHVHTTRFSIIVCICWVPRTLPSCLLDSGTSSYNNLYGG